MTDEEGKRLAERVERAEAKADQAAEVAMGAVETIKHLQAAAEAAHAREGENLAAMRKMVNIVEALSRPLLGPPRATTVGGKRPPKKSA